MAKADLPQEFRKRLQAITAKRAKTVIEHILKHGSISTEQLKDVYDYNHPPRAIRDVRENGIPLEKFSVKGADGRTIAAYRFGDLSKITSAKLGGRVAWPKKFKQTLIEMYGCACGVCLADYESRYLQIDHRVPYEVVGDTDETPDPADFLLVCGSCNRAKSWSCEHCQNWTTDKKVTVCRTCYWANPQNHAHIALRLIRRLDLTWSGEEVDDYEDLVRISAHDAQPLPDFVKQVLKERLAED